MICLGQTMPLLDHDLVADASAAGFVVVFHSHALCPLARELQIFRRLHRGSGHVVVRNNHATDMIGYFSSSKFAKRTLYTGRPDVVKHHDIDTGFHDLPGNDTVK